MSRGGLIVAALVTSCAAEHKTVHFVRHGEALHNPKAGLGTYDTAAAAAVAVAKSELKCPARPPVKIRTSKPASHRCDVQTPSKLRAAVARGTLSTATVSRLLVKHRGEEVLPERTTAGRTKRNLALRDDLGEREPAPDPRAGQPIDVAHLSTQLRFPLAGSRSGDAYTLAGYQRCFARFGDDDPETLGAEGNAHAADVLRRLHEAHLLWTSATQKQGVSMTPSAGGCTVVLLSGHGKHRETHHASAAVNGFCNVRAGAHDARTRSPCLPPRLYSV